MSTVTLIDGREVKRGSFAHEAQVMAIDRHISNLRGRNTEQRREYLNALQRTDGGDMAEAVKAAYVADWESRKGVRA